MKKIATMLMLVLLVLVFDSGYAADNENFVGTWVLSEINSNGTIRNPEQLGLSMQLTLNKDSSSSMLRNNIELKGTWAFDLNNIYILSNQSSESAGYSFEGGNLALARNGTIYIFSPQVPEITEKKSENTNQEWEPIFANDKLPIQPGKLETVIGWDKTTEQLKSIFNGFEIKPNIMEVPENNNMSGFISFDFDLDGFSYASYQFHYFYGLIYNMVLRIEPIDIYGPQPGDDEVTRIYDTFIKQFPINQLYKDNTSDLAKFYQNSYYKSSGYYDNVSYIFIYGHRATDRTSAYVCVELWEKGEYESSINWSFSSNTETAYGQFDETSNNIVTDINEIVEDVPKKDQSEIQHDNGVITGAQCKYPAYLKKDDTAEIINVTAIPIYADDLKTILTYAYPGKNFKITSQPYCKGTINYYHVNFIGWEGLLQETLNDVYVIQKVD